MVSDGYHRLAHRYEALTPVQDWVADQMVRQWSGLNSPASVLELGCGTGRLTRRLSQSGMAKHITAIDRSPAMIAVARQRDVGGIASYHIADLDSLSITEPVQWVMSNQTLHWLSDPIGSILNINQMNGGEAQWLISVTLASSFNELSSVLRAVMGIQGIAADRFWNSDRWQAGLGSVFSNTQYRFWTIQETFPDSIRLLRTAQASVGALSEPLMFSKRHLEQIDCAMTQAYGGLILTYHVMVAQCQI